MVHAAMSKVGPLLNGPDALSNAVLDVIGPEGTMLVYTSWDSVHEDLMNDDGRVLAKWRDHVPGFDPRASRAVRMDRVITEFVRTMPGGFRSGNPGASVAAIGKLRAADDVGDRLCRYQRLRQHIASLAIFDGDRGGEIVHQL